MRGTGAQGADTALAGRAAAGFSTFSTLGSSQLPLMWNSRVLAAATGRLRISWARKAPSAMAGLMAA